MSIIRSSMKAKSLENNLYFVCEKCRYQLAHRQMREPGKFVDSVKAIKALYDERMLGQEAYHDLLRLAISIYVANEVSTSICDKLDSALTEKLSPDRFLEALA